MHKTVIMKTMHIRILRHVLNEMVKKNEISAWNLWRIYGCSTRALNSSSILCLNNEKQKVVYICYVCDEEGPRVSCNT